MTISPEAEAEIRRLYFVEHWKVGTIATEQDHHPDVVRRVLGLQVSRHAPSVPAPSLVDPYAEFIRETLERHPRLRATRLFDMIRPRGYQGSTRTLRSYVASVRPRPKREVFVRTETLPGEQAQIDWAHVAKTKVAGGERSLWAFVMVLAYSRAMWAELVYDLTVHSVRRSIVRAVEYFGGSTRQWLFDNPRTIVLARADTAMRLHPQMVELSSLYNTQIKLCGVRKPTHKGKVERAIRYLRERFFAGREVHSIEQGNRELLAFCSEIAHPRPHPRFPNQRVADCFEQERESLLPLPSASPSVEYVTPIAVDKTAFIRFDTNQYSVPPAHAEQTLTLAADDRFVRVLNGTTEVARHTRSWGRRQMLEALEHRAQILEHKRGARDLKGRDRLRVVLPEIDQLFARWIEAGRHLGSMTAKTIKLLDLYGDAILAEAFAEMLERDTHDPSALAVLCEKRRRAHDRPVPIEIVLGHNVPDRDVIPHDLEGYDAPR